MTLDLKKELAAVAAALGVLSLLSSWVIFPYRLTAAEKKIAELEIIRAQDHDLLLRIDGRLFQIQSTLSQEKQKP